MNTESENLAEPAERVKPRLAGRKMRYEKHRRRRKVTLVAAGFLLCCGIAAVVLWAVLGHGETLPTVPDVVGMSFKEAGQAIEAAGLAVEIEPSLDILDLESASDIKVDGQDPGKGVTVPKDTLVTVSLEGVPARAGETGAAESAGAAPEAPAEQPPPEAAPQPAQPAPAAPSPPALAAPVDGPLLYPYTRDASIACGHWQAGSQDYPYFGAPRDGGSRMHAGVDLYPAAGVGAPVRAIKDGSVIKVAVFYTRYTGEATYGVLVNHVDFVANYAELQPVGLGVGSTVARGQEIGRVSGTQQLHFEMYAPGTTSWNSWRGDKPANLLDPTGLMTGLGL